MNKNKLYNVIFPIWLLVLYPVHLLFVLPANFLIDYLILRLGAKHLKLVEYKQVAKKAIMKTWLLGFLADIIGGLILFLFNFFAEFGWYDFVNAMMYNPLSRLDAFFFVALCVLLTAGLIYIFNLKYSFSRLDFELEKKKRLALYLAVFTAPYLFLLPTMWFVI